MWKFDKYKVCDKPIFTTDNSIFMLARLEQSELLNPEAFVDFDLQYFRVIRKLLIWRKGWTLVDFL